MRNILLIPKQNSYSSYLPKKVLTDEALLAKAQAAILAMQNSWKFCLATQGFHEFSWTEEFSNLALFPTLISSKNLPYIVQELASKVYFDHVQIVWLKTCHYHVERKNEKLLSKKEAEKLELKLSSQYKNDPHISADSVSLSKTKRRGDEYDVRIKFKHIDDVKECDYPAISLAEKIKVNALEVLQSLERQLVENEESITNFYKNIAQIVFEDRLLIKEDVACL